MKGFKKFRDESMDEDWGSLDEYDERKERNKKDKRSKRKARFDEKHQST